MILGEGCPRIERGLPELAAQFPEKVAVRVEFSEPLAHRIVAGADIYAMPSRFEPCGLNQMYAQRYGTVPVVRGTGGLKDTVVDVTPESLATGRATGFVFQEATVDALAEAMQRACQAFGDKALWWTIARAGMQQDWSWSACTAVSAALRVDCQPASGGGGRCRIARWVRTELGKQRVGGREDGSAGTGRLCQAAWARLR